MSTMGRTNLKKYRKEIGDITFAIALKSERESQELTRKDFCKFLDISIQSLYDLEHGRRIPTPGRAAKIARQIGEPEAYWVELALKDELKACNLKLNISVSSAS